MNEKISGNTYTLHNQVEIPCVGFGTWQVPDGETAANAVMHAIEAGYTHIDTAIAYHNEIGVGAGIRMSGVAREKLFVTSKPSDLDISLLVRAENEDAAYEALKKAYEL